MSASSAARLFDRARVGRGQEQQRAAEAKVGLVHGVPILLGSGPLCLHDIAIARRGEPAWNYSSSSSSS